MPDPDELEGRRLPTKFTLANVLIYLAPMVWFWWLGPFWKVASFISVGFGVWRSPGFLRRFFGVTFLLSLLIWGAHAKETEQDWPGPVLLNVWWFMSFGTRWHADGAKAEADAQRPPRGWE